MDAPETSPLPPPGSSPRSLLVDSVIPILRALASMLDPYVIEMATSGALALDRLASLPTIDLILCDLQLDDLDGRSLYRQACARSPELHGRFVFLTGDRASPEYDVDTSTPVLLRPFELDRLLAVVHDLLNRQPPRAEA